MNMFRTLRADEIDCRIAQIKKTGDSTGLSLLLYKDARCDQNILDETVGPMNWERKHSRENANCTVSIWDEKNGRWVSKEDTGTESNTEKEKGLASDSFKRACFNWGIGRELYTAPFIWISGKDCNIVDRNGKPQCYDRFTVHGIGYTDGVITGLEIKNQKTGKICFRYGEITSEAPERPEKPDNEPEEQPKAKQGQGTVAKTTDFVPSKNPVKEYISNEITFMQQMFGVSDRKEMMEKFAWMRRTLIEKGIIPDKKSDDQTMEEAQKMVDEIYANFKPDGEIRDRTA